MKPPVKRVILSEQGRNNVITIKRRTGLEGNNVIARLGYCYSLSVDSPPTPMLLNGPRSTMEMTWDTFAMGSGPPLILALKVYCRQHGIPTDELSFAEQFGMHVDRGVGYIAGDPRIQSIETLYQYVILPSIPAPTLNVEASLQLAPARLELEAEPVYLNVEAKLQLEPATVTLLLDQPTEPEPQISRLLPSSRPTLQI